MSERPETTGRQRAYEEFLEPGPLPAGADLNAAEARLLEALEREAGVPLGPEPDPGLVRARRTEAPALETEGPGGLGGRIARWLGAPRLRPAFALAVVIVAAVGVWSQMGPRREGEAPLLRGPAGGTAGAWGAHARTTALDARRTRLAWTPAPQATGYAVIFLAYAGADELARSPASTLSIP
jgi:hypothetical protein